MMLTLPFLIVTTGRKGSSADELSSIRTWSRMDGLEASNPQNWRFVSRYPALPLVPFPISATPA